MSHRFQPTGDTLDHRVQPEPGQEYDRGYEQDQEYEQERPAARPSASRLAELGDRIARAFSGADREAPQEPALEPVVAPYPGGGDREDVAAQPPGRFPVAARGYDRAEVDEHVAELERELEELRGRHVPVSISEEIERIGEQTATILVVAHDQAHETRRLAQEQADRCIADAAANAVAITEQATQRLRELDNETDAVWRERRRLIEDVHLTGTALVALAAEAVDRFPEESKGATVSFDVPAGWESEEGGPDG